MELKLGHVYQAYNSGKWKVVEISADPDDKLPYKLESLSGGGFDHVSALGQRIIGQWTVGDLAIELTEKAPEPVTAPLKFEVGKKYVNRKGDVYEVRRINHPSPYTIFAVRLSDDRGRAFTADGLWIKDDVSRLDLISEYTEPAPEPAFESLDAEPFTEAPLVFEVGGKYKDRCGQSYKVICIDAPGESPVIAVRISNLSDYSNVMEYTASGRYDTEEESRFDLIDVYVEPREYWIDTETHEVRATAFPPLRGLAPWNWILVREVLS